MLNRRLNVRLTTRFSSAGRMKSAGKIFLSGVDVNRINAVEDLKHGKPNDLIDVYPTCPR